MSFGEHMKKHGHLWPYHCEVHNCGHGGACSLCLRDRDKRRELDYKQSLHDKINSLQSQLDAKTADLLKLIEVSNKAQKVLADYVVADEKAERVCEELELVLHEVSG